MKIARNPFGKWFCPMGYFVISPGIILEPGDCFFSSTNTCDEQELLNVPSSLFGMTAGKARKFVFGTAVLVFIRALSQEETVGIDHVTEDILNAADSPAQPAQPVEQRQKFHYDGDDYVRLLDSDTYRRYDFFVYDGFFPDDTSRYRTSASLVDLTIEDARRKFITHHSTNGYIWRLADPFARPAPEKLSYNDLVSQRPIKRSTRPVEVDAFDIDDVVTLDDSDIVREGDISISPDFPGTSFNFEFAFRNARHRSSWGGGHYVTCAGGFGGWGCGDYTVKDIKKKVGGGSVMRWKAYQGKPIKRIVAKRTIDPLPLP